MGLLSKILGDDEPIEPPPTHLPLPPLPRPVYLFPNSPYLAQNPVTLTLKRRLKSGDRYPICLTTDPDQRQPLFFLNYSDMSMHETKSLYDAQGKFLFDIKERQSTWKTQCYVKTENEDRVGNIGKEKYGQVLGQFGTVEEGTSGGNELYREGDVLSVREEAWGKGRVDVKIRDSGMYRIFFVIEIALLVLSSMLGVKRNKRKMRADYFGTDR